MSDSEIVTKTGADPHSLQAFREEFHREAHADFREHHRTLRETNDRLTALETLIKLHIQEMEQWRKVNEGAFAAANKLDQATHGARMMVLAVFGVSTCILAVSGVMHLSYELWRKIAP